MTEQNKAAAKMDVENIPAITLKDLQGKVYKTLKKYDSAPSVHFFKFGGISAEKMDEIMGGSSVPRETIRQLAACVQETFLDMKGVTFQSSVQSCLAELSRNSWLEKFLRRGEIYVGFSKSGKTESSAWTLDLVDALNVIPRFIFAGNNAVQENAVADF